MGIIEELRAITKENISIHEQSGIHLNLFSTELTMNHVIISIYQENLWLIPKFKATNTLTIEADEMYPILFNPQTDEMVMDTSNALPFDDEGRTLLAYAMLVYLHANAKGVEQKAFYQVTMENFEKAMSKFK